MSMFCLLPDMSLLHAQTLQCIQELKYYSNQPWKERAEWFIPDLLNLRRWWFRPHSWGFFRSQWPPGMTNPDKSALVSFCFSVCGLSWIHLGRQAERQENLVQSFTDWMELWSTCCSHSNGLYRTNPGRLIIADPSSRASCWSAPGSRLSRQWRKTSSTFSGNWTSVFAYSFSTKILLVDMVFLGLKCL